MFDGLTSTLISAALTVINLLPESPFRALIDSFNDTAIHQILCYVNYILPVAQMLSVFSLWLAGVGIYYVYQLIFRWVRMID